MTRFINIFGRKTVYIIIARDKTKEGQKDIFPYFKIFKKE